MQFGILGIWQSDKESHGASFQPATPQKMLTAAMYQQVIKKIHFFYRIADYLHG